MAILNKDIYENEGKAIYKHLLHLADTDIPVVTTDEVATAIQVNKDGDATGFTSLTDHNCSKSCSSQVIS